MKPTAAPVRPLLLPLLLVALLLALAPGPAAAQPATFERYAGQNRFETARLIAEDTFDAAERVIIASAQDWPDALAGGYLAGQLDAPLLLVARDAVPDPTLEALEALGAESVTLLGGEAAIRPAVAAQLEQAGYEVERRSGASRYETAAAIAAVGVEVGLWGGQRTAIVASGEGFADALVASALAFSEGFPILLTPGARLHPVVAEALSELDIERVLVPGGAAAVADGVVAAIEALEIEVVRVREEGGGRWETALALADLASTEFGYSREHLDFATGFDFADALSMGPHAGLLEAPLLLTPGTQSEPPAAVTNWLALHACDIDSAHIGGGEAAVSSANAEALAAAAGDCDDDRYDVRINERTVTPGEVVQALFTVPDERQLAAIAVAGPCVRGADIWTSNTLAPAADDILAGFQIDAGAEPGDCRIVFTLRHGDGSTVDLVREVTVGAG